MDPFSWKNVSFLTFLFQFINQVYPATEGKKCRPVNGEKLYSYSIPDAARAMQLICLTRDTLIFLYRYLKTETDYDIIGKSNNYTACSITCQTFSQIDTNKIENLTRSSSRNIFKTPTGIVH